jgi:cytochrome b involved in lipid metabolism
MEEKVVRDCQLWGNDDSNLWIVENKIYDLTDFVQKHPGGSTWLTLTKGQDITEHFVVHHLR